ncbi:calponin y domain-containing protein [Holotrichia oblita]|uniref:Calponin y domain-containing protein n=1 Tax=Holotrichia oblita TaxID=644536 RepID=A0ACB9TAC5_HOLOL|nr:calponin y domain-containing protein [Holotrichia oblita]
MPIIGGHGILEIILRTSATKRLNIRSEPRVFNLPGLLSAITNARCHFAAIHISTKIALDDNPGVAPELIGQDILGLLMQEFNPNHLLLLIAVLDLLHHSLRHSPADELAECSVPINMLPIFFNMQTEHISHWRRIAMIFMEVTRFSPSYFQLDTEEFNDTGIHNFVHQNRGVNNALLQRRLLEMNVVLRMLRF